MTTQAVPKPTWPVIVARIWAGFMALCHLGGLAGALVPLFVPPTYTSDYHPAIVLLSTVHHIIALVAAGMLFALLRSARFALLLAVALNTAYCVLCVISLSAPVAIAGFGFGLALYVPPLALIYWRSEEFH
ncbi:MAG: hypothetical protein V7609_328 [Verrucomicrobiota bacterium]